MRDFRLGRLIPPAVAAVILVIGLLIAPANAQSPSGSNPTEQAVSEQQLFDELQKIQGRITIPDAKAATLEQPQGRDYRGFREGALPWIGGIAVLGMLLLLALFYFIRGKIRTQAPESNVKLLRFNVVERLVHWTTATAFIILAITGLNFIFGKRLLMPLIGPDAFSTWSQWAKYAHDFASWAFMLGILIMLVIWAWDNLPDRYDAHWLKVGGGFFDKSNRTHPPAGRFNTGQKLIFWSVIIGGAALSVSGIYLLFPFDFADVNGMQWAQYIHATIGVLMIAVIIAHIYIGTLGMEGAFEAMGSGTVDLNWAKEHHSAWAGPALATAGAGSPGRGTAAPIQPAAARSPLGAAPVERSLETVGGSAPSAAAFAQAAVDARPHEAGRPKGIGRPAISDDLKLISGVGPKIEGTLNELGIYLYEQIAGWSRVEREWVDTYLDFKGRIEREDWVRQAKALAEGGEAEYLRVFGKRPR